MIYGSSLSLIVGRISTDESFLAGAPGLSKGRLRTMSTSPVIERKRTHSARPKSNSPRDSEFLLESRLRIRLVRLQDKKLRKGI